MSAAMRRPYHLLLVCTLGLLGLLAAYHPMLLARLTRMQTDPGDTRHLNYILEHEYRWLVGHDAHRELLSPAVFYPQKDTLAYSETLLGVAPFYVPFRLVGLKPDTAFQFWVLTVSVLNFLAMHMLLWWGLRFGPIASAGGAYLFAFASIRVVQSGHQHLIPHFFTVAALLAGVMLFRDGAAPARRERLCVAVFFLALVAQVYASVYLAWFLFLSLAIALGWATVLSGARKAVGALLQRRWPTITMAAMASAVAVFPLLDRHVHVAESVGYRSYSMVKSMLPPPASFLNLGPYSWLYSWTSDWTIFTSMTLEWEKRLGLGVATSLVVAWGLWKGRKLLVVKLVALTGASVVALALLVGGEWSLWQYVYSYIPGAQAIRAVGRFGLLLLVPASLGLAVALSRLRERRAWALTVAIGLALVIEQGQTMPSYDKFYLRRETESLARSIPTGCTAFYYANTSGPRPFWELQLDAMWAEMLSGVPTVNGYSSNFPPGNEPLIENNRPGAEAAAAREHALAAWAASHGLPRDAICLIQQ